jgi:SAM-dependent methyltransferase
VLHIGCIGETNEPLEERICALQEGRALHSRLKRVASEVVGIDSDRDAVALAVTAGFTEISWGDAENLPKAGVSKGDPFDVVVAGDVIEHLSRPGELLAGASTLVTDDGELIVTCPNAFGLPNYLRFLGGRFREGPDHVVTFTRFTLSNLFLRHGWSVVLINTGHEEQAERIVGPLFRLGKVALSRLPELGGTLIAVGRRSLVEA